jgi:hypothetical protein
MIKLRDILFEDLNDSWDDGETKVTLRQLLVIMSKIPTQEIDVSKVSQFALYKNNSGELNRIEASNLEFPILIITNNNGSINQIIDGHHRIQKAIKHNMPTIKAKIIKFNDLPADFKKVLG